MKKNFSLVAILVLASMALFSFTRHNAGGIKGTISPADGAVVVWAISGSDSVKTTPVEGIFGFADIKAGTYKIVVEANAPYKTVEKDNIIVSDGEIADLGTIALEQ